MHRLKPLLKQPVAMYPALAELTGCLTGGVFLSQALYWTQRSSKSDGWFWKTREEWTKETFLGRFEQERARYILKELGVLEEREDRINHRVFYRVNMESLVASLESGKAIPKPSRGSASNLRGGCSPTSGAVGKPLPLLISEITSENTHSPKSETTQSGSGAPAKPERVVSERGLKFAEWFRTLLPGTMKLAGNWQKNWAKCYDDMIRLDQRNDSEIVAVCKWARGDVRFWQGAFFSPMKLREKKNDVMYFDQFIEKMKETPKQNGYHKGPAPKGGAAIPDAQRSKAVDLSEIEDYIPAKETL